MAEIARARYAQLYGPTVGDRVRLADTTLLIEVEQDWSAPSPGDEAVFGGGKVIRVKLGALQYMGSARMRVGRGAGLRAAAVPLEHADRR